MRTFSRTAAGIRNYPSFYGVDFVVFTEGKEQSDQSPEERPDAQYFTAVLTEASGGLLPKVKCIGNKEAALDYAIAISTHSIRNSIVVVDKDLEGIISSSLVTGNVIRTYGYSWENEMWSYDVIMRVSSIISASNKKVDCIINGSFRKLEKRAKYLSILDLATRFYGVALLQKSKRLGGIRFVFPHLPLGEVRRMRSVFDLSPAPRCSFCRQIITKVSGLNAQEIIQGHLWENIAFRLITSALKTITDDTFPSNGVLRRIGFSVLNEDVSKAVSPFVLSYYRSELVRIGILVNR
jgi:hypothetical protein